MKMTITHMKKNDWIGILFVSFIIILFAVSYARADEDRDKIYDQCFMRFQSNPKMIITCFNQQIRSYNNVERYYDKYLKGIDPDNLSNISREARVVIRCSNKWRDRTFDTYNWDLIDYCISGNI